MVAIAVWLFWLVLLLPLPLPFDYVLFAYVWKLYTNKSDWLKSLTLSGIGLGALRLSCQFTSHTSHNFLSRKPISAEWWIAQRIYHKIDRFDLGLRVLDIRRLREDSSDLRKKMKFQWCDHTLKSTLTNWHGVNRCIQIFFTCSATDIDWITSRIQCVLSTIDDN